MARETLAAIYVWLGETDLGIRYLKENLSACLDINHFGLYIRTLRMLAEVACWRGRRELAKRILDKIENELDTNLLDEYAHLLISHIKVMILRLRAEQRRKYQLTDGRLIKQTPEKRFLKNLARRFFVMRYSWLATRTILLI